MPLPLASNHKRTSQILVILSMSTPCTVKRESCCINVDNAYIMKLLKIIYKIKVKYFDTVKYCYVNEISWGLQWLEAYAFDQLHRNMHLMGKDHLPFFFPFFKFSYLLVFFFLVLCIHLLANMSHSSVDHSFFHCPILYMRSRFGNE
jgi:hypothetical protein